VTQPQPVPGQPPPEQEGTAGQAGGIVAILPYAAVLLCTAGGSYVAWSLGSAGGGTGGVIVGAGLLAAAAARLVLPPALVTMLANRKRATDVLTLTIFGAGLLAAGLVLPR
jgi:hypothetical protein